MNLVRLIKVIVHSKQINVSRERGVEQIAKLFKMVKTKKKRQTRQEKKR